MNDSGTVTSDKQQRATVLELLGGKLGLFEATAPLTVYMIVYAINKQPVTAGIIALAVAAGPLLVRLIRRESLRHSVNGLIGLGIGVLLVKKTGKAETIFLPKIFTNLAIMTVLLGLLAFKSRTLPLIETWYRTLTGAQEGDDATLDPKLVQTLLLLWISLFAFRLLVEIPLYLMGETVLLGAVSPFIGPGLFALALLASFTLASRSRAASQSDLLS